MRPCLITFYSDHEFVIGLRLETVHFDSFFLKKSASLAFSLSKPEFDSVCKCFGN